MRNISAIATTMICMVASALNAQGAPLVFGSKTEVVNLSVSVSDKKNRYVDNLTVTDFVVYENSVEQKIVIFERQQLPIQAIILLDTSPSMNLAFKNARAAAAGFIDTLRPEDRASIKMFDRIVMTLQDFTNDHDLLKKGLMHISHGDTTRLYEAVRSALHDFGPPNPNQRRIIILITDGEDIDSSSSAEMALADATRSDVSFYCIMTPTGDKSRGHLPIFEQAYNFLTALSNNTGGRSWAIFEKINMRLAYQILARELKMQYRIGYAVEHPKDPGPDREIKVLVRGQHEYTLRYRNHYTFSRRP